MSMMMMMMMMIMYVYMYNRKNVVLTTSESYIDEKVYCVCK
jgi:hypothetical protein